MTVRADQIARELSSYVHDHPREVMALMPLYDALRDHNLLGACPHRRRCPLITAGALILYELPADDPGRIAVDQQTARSTMPLVTAATFR
ncbi:hypothetical protein ABZ832_10685 [Streptantibioticus parmotrematis]|uniref:hypothetical protein n=1 Tax=Streptantibioticus parmotrematis TaxID=2873249 RepID=UPI0033DCE5AF